MSLQVPASQMERAEHEILELREKLATVTRERDEARAAQGCTAGQLAARRGVATEGGETMRLTDSQIFRLEMSKNRDVTAALDEVATLRAEVERLKKERDGWQRAAESQNRQWAAKCTEATEARAEVERRDALLRADGYEDMRRHAQGLAERNAELERERDEARAALRGVKDALSDILGQQHVLKHTLDFLGKWGDDPVYADSVQRKAEVARSTEAVAEWHRRVVLALSLVTEVKP